LTVKLLNINTARLKLLGPNNANKPVAIPPINSTFLKTVTSTSLCRYGN